MLHSTRLSCNILYAYRRHRSGPRPLFPTENGGLLEERPLRVRQPGKDFPCGSAPKPSRDHTPEADRVLIATPTLSISGRANIDTPQSEKIEQSHGDWTPRRREGGSEDSEEPQTPLLRKRTVRCVCSGC